MQSSNGIKITLNGVSYLQKGEEIMAKIERGEIPPPSKDRRRKLKLGAYAALVSEMIKRKFSNATIQKVLEDHGIKVNYNTVNKFCQVIRNRKPPIAAMTVGVAPAPANDPQTILSIIRQMVQNGNNMTTIHRILTEKGLFNASYSTLYAICRINGLTRTC
jgi:hypothetical protein